MRAAGRRGGGAGSARARSPRAATLRRCTPRHSNNRRRAPPARRCCSVLAFIVKTMMTQFFQVDIEGWENLDQTKTPSAVMVANHQSAIDSLIFGYLWSHNFKVRARAGDGRGRRLRAAACARAGRLPLDARGVRASAARPRDVMSGCLRESAGWRAPTHCARVSAPAPGAPRCRRPSRTSSCTCPASACACGLQGTCPSSAATRRRGHGACEGRARVRDRGEMPVSMYTWRPTPLHRGVRARTRGLVQ